MYAHVTKVASVSLSSFFSMSFSVLTRAGEGDIEFRDVSLQWLPPPEPSVLEHLTFDVAPGELVMVCALYHP